MFTELQVHAGHYTNGPVPQISKAQPACPLHVYGAFSIMFQQISEILLREEEARSLTYNKRN